MLQNTRRRRIQLPTKTWESADNPLTWALPKAGLLAQVDINVRLAMAGTLTAPNALGQAAIIRQVKVATSLGFELIRVSGAGYNYMTRYFLEHNVDPVPYSTARSAIATGVEPILDMHFPMAINSRDDFGLLPLQVEEMQATLTVEKESIANLATGLTGITGTVTPYLTIYSVPDDPKDWPAFQVLHSLVEEQRAVSGAGQFTYQWPVGDVYLQMIHGLNLLQAAADNFTTFKVVIGQSDTILQETPASLDIEFAKYRGIARRLGLSFADFMSSTGLGNYGPARDWLDTAAISDIASIWDAAAAGTLYTQRRILVPVKQ